MGLRRLRLSMETLLNLLHSLLPLGYGLAAANYIVHFVRQDPFAERTVTPMLAGTFGVHWLYLLLVVVHYGRPPVVGVAEALSVIAIAVAGVYLYVEKIQGNKFTGAFILPMVVVLQLASTALDTPQTGPVSALLASPLFGLHAVIALLGYSAFAVGAVYGIMYLALYRSLKRKEFGLAFERLPSLDSLANMGFWATFLGWVSLTLTIGLGALMSMELVPGFYRDLKFITTVMVWAVYGTCVVAHFALGWRGARSVYLSLAGFGFAIFAMFGSSFLWSSFHSFQA